MTPVTATSKTDGVPFVYKISNSELCYYGSTERTLDERKWNHMSTSNKCSSRVITRCELPWTMEVVEYVACTTKEELEDREAFYILNNECVNVYIPGSERRAGGKTAYNKQKCRQYKQDNKEKLNAKHSCDICGGKFTWTNKKQHYKTKKHQKALAEAVALHTPPPPPTVVNNITNNHCNITNNHK